MKSGIQRSRELFERAQQLLPGGVNSPVRAFRAVGGDPLFIQRAEGSWIWDADDNPYIDFVGSWGPMILGHRHPDVLEALRKALERGTSFGAPSDLEIELAELLVEAVPSVERARMVNSGTEAAMAAIRLARGITGRHKIVKFEGCYHGHADGLLVKAGSGAMTFGVPTSAGVPEDYATLTLTLPYNDLDTFTRTLDPLAEQVACVIVEPVAGNMGVIPPSDGFLQGIREWTRRAGAILVFDEVITGFRIAPGGAQQRYGVEPDLTCLGKILGGGLPVGAYGGPTHVMERVAPMGDVYQAGTLSGNPLAMAAGIATLRNLKDQGIYDHLEEKGRQLEQAFSNAARKAGIPLHLNRVGSMLGAFFTDQPVRDHATAQRCDTERYARFFREMLKRGVYFAPSQFEAIFLSVTHGDKELAAAAEALEDVMKTLAA